MKRLLCVMCVLTLCVSVVACGGNSSTKEETVAVEDTNKAIEETTEVVKETEIVTEKPTETEPETETETETETEAVDNTPIIAVGETIEIPDVCEFSIDYTNITKDVMPPKPGSWYSHYQADDGKAYADVCVAYKNLETSDKMADEVGGGKLKYNNKFEFSGFSTIEEDSRGDFTYTNITSIAPLTTEYVHYLFEIPEEVQDGGLVEAILTIGGNDYKVIVQDGDVAAEDASENKELGKTSGNIDVGETIVTQNSEFNIDYADITKDVMPPKPGSWYSHYEADDGKVYVDVCVAYKNTSGNNVGADEVLNAKMKYADKYDFTGFSTIEEDNRGDFTYSNITSIAPLTTEYVHYLFEVPEEVEQSSEPIAITMIVDGNTYTYNLR